LAFEKAKEMSIRKVMDALEMHLVILLSWQFLKLVLIANVPTIPTGFFLMNKWLEEFAYRISIPVYIFLAASGITVVVVLLTVAYHAYNTAITNPVNVLVQE